MAFGAKTQQSSRLHQQKKSQGKGGYSVYASNWQNQDRNQGFSEPVVIVICWDELFLEEQNRVHGILMHEH